jgi:hypothetical protein
MVTEPLSNRRRSSQASTGCLVPFFSVFLLAGCAAFYFTTVRPVLRYQAARSWRETTCTVLSSQVGEHSDSDGTTYSVDVLYTYSDGYRSYQSGRYDFLGGSSSGRQGKEEAVARYPPGARVQCWVDPAHPEEAVLSREPSAMWLIGLFPLLFVIIGGGGMVWAIRAGRRRGSAAAPFQTSPQALMTATRGTLELKPDAGPWAKFAGMTFLALFWNGIVSVFVYQAVATWRAGTPDGCMTAFLIPFVLIGLLLIYGAISQFLVLFNPRLRLTLSPGALAPGGNGFLQWSCSGWAGRIRRLTLVLEGREEAQYRRGTSTYTDREVFATLTVLDSVQPFEIREGSISFGIPPGTVPSFTADHNKIRWALKAHCDIPGWPDSDDEYEILVKPAGGG